MPNSPTYGIPYPCEGAAISPADFAAFAAGVEAAIASANAAITAARKGVYAIQMATVNPAVNTPTTFTFTASAENSSSGITVGATSFTAQTAGVYLSSVYFILGQSLTSTTTATYGQIGMRVGAVNQNLDKRRGYSSLVLPRQQATGMLILGVGSVVDYQYLWGGTGALSAPVLAKITLERLTTL